MHADSEHICLPFFPLPLLVVVFIGWTLINLWRVSRAIFIVIFQLLILIISGQSCICHPNSVSAVVYDSSVRLPICRRHNCTTNTTNCTSNSIQSPAHCPIYHLHETISPVHTSKYIQIIANETTPKNDLSAKCDQTVAECANPKEYSRFDDYCIPQNLLKDYQSYRQFRMSMPFIIDIYANLDVLVFLCQTVRPSIYCEYIANLCVLSKYVPRFIPLRQCDALQNVIERLCFLSFFYSYAMEKNSPCNVFFATQTTLYTSNGFDGTQTKLVPFLFYPKGRNTIDDVDKVIDQRYKYKRNGEDYDAEGLDAIGYYSVNFSISNSPFWLNVCHRFLSIRFAANQ